MSGDELRSALLREDGLTPGAAPPEALDAALYRAAVARRRARRVRVAMFVTWVWAALYLALLGWMLVLVRANVSAAWQPWIEASMWAAVLCTPGLPLAVILTIWSALRARAAGQAELNARLVRVERMLEQLAPASPHVDSPASTRAS